jgi:hypothetical protein
MKSECSVQAEARTEKAAPADIQARERENWNY